MNIDANGLPVQADGDAMDQLQRCGMIAVGQTISHRLGVYPADLLPRDPMVAIVTDLQPRPGVFVRHPGADPCNCSADQIIAALGGYIINGISTKHIFREMITRGGFAQNTRDGLNGDNTKWKLPDFMFLRAAPLFSRSSRWLYPIAMIADLYLLIMAASAVLDRDPDHVDHNNTILTLAVCSMVMPTPVSWIARKLFTRFLPYNYGCMWSVAIDGAPLDPINKMNAFYPVYGSLRWYHRASSGGNPEIARLWAPICATLFS